MDVPSPDEFLLLMVDKSTHAGNVHRMANLRHLYISRLERVQRMSTKPCDARVWAEEVAKLHDAERDLRAAIAVP